MTDIARKPFCAGDYVHIVNRAGRCIDARYIDHLDVDAAGEQWAAFAHEGDRPGLPCFHVPAERLRREDGA